MTTRKRSTAVDDDDVDAAQPRLVEQADGSLVWPSAPSVDLPGIMGSVGEAVYEWQLDSDLLLWSDNAAALLGVADPAAIATGRAYAKLLDAESTETRFDAVMRSEQADPGGGVPFTAQYCLRPGTAAGRKTWIEDTGRWFAGPRGRPARVHGVIRVINERRERERELEYLARYDALTGEMNRRYLLENLEAILDESIRSRGTCGFLLAAIDNLGRINEAYGFDVADDVIAAVGKRIRSRMRGGDCLGRFSGNKFGLILKNCTPDDMVNAADRLLAGVRDDVIPTCAGPVAVTVTIGGVNAPRHARTVDEIVARAHETLAAAKKKRHGSFLGYRPSLEREASRRENVRSTDDIVTALNDRRVQLAYEPVAAAKSRQTAFYECLMRIQRPDGTMVPAHEVIPAAERLGLVRLLDHRVAELVVAELVVAPELQASLNVSPASTCDPDWWAGLGAMLRAQPNVAGRLTVEITEMAAIHDIDDTRGFVARVKDLGCRIAIDDFGAGYTSFRNLRKLGVDIVKIDGAFVQNMLRSEDDRAFVHTLIDLARRLGLKTVAEWVQDEHTAAMLAGWGCDYLQGSLIGLASNERLWLTPHAESRPGLAATA